MNKLSSIALVALFASSVAVAAEPATAPIKQPAATPAPAVVPQKTSLSQQDKMRECNKQATGKKGAERKTFMKECLSKKA